MHYIEIGSAGIKYFGEIDVRFHVCFVLVEIGDCDILPGAGHEAEAHPLSLHDHLIVRSEGGRTAGLARVDRVARGNAHAVRLVGWIFSSGDNGGFIDPDSSWCVCVYTGFQRCEHQEKVLAGRRIGQTELHVLIGSNEKLVRQVNWVVGILLVWMLYWLVLNRPDPASRYRRSRLFDISRKYNWSCGTARATDNDVVITGIRI